MEERDFGIGIIGTGSYLPNKIETNEELCKTLPAEITPEWIIQKTGIKARRIAEEPEFTNTEPFTPSHFDHFFSNSIVSGPFVSLGVSSCNIHSDRAVKSFLSIVSDTRLILFENCFIHFFYTFI